MWFNTIRRVSFFVKFPVMLLKFEIYQEFWYNYK
nr:MAG TPA: hypothetical protein [Caudoviricetes sp.]